MLFVSIVVSMEINRQHYFWSCPHTSVFKKKITLMNAAKVFFANIKHRCATKESKAIV